MKRALVLACLLALLVPGTAAATGGLDAHELEHQEILAGYESEEAYLASLSPQERRTIERRIEAREAAADALDPAVAGSWGPAFKNTSFGMHTALLKTGKVLFWSLPLGRFGTQPNVGVSWLWDPAKGTGDDAFQTVALPKVDLTDDNVNNPVEAPLYCSGQSFLPDGTVLAAGGNLRWPARDGNGNATENYVGWDAVFTFDPDTEQWTREPDTAKGRWYPSQVLMADGRTAILAGYDESGAIPEVDNDDLEFFTPGANPGQGTITAQPFADGTTYGLYPHTFLMPGGDVLMAGPNRGDSALLKPESDTPAGAYWDYHFGAANAPANRVRAARHRTGGTGVLVPGGPNGSSKVLQIGGWGGTGEIPLSNDAATPTTEMLDIAPAGGTRPAWAAAQPLNIGRAYHNTVLLPDGSMVTVGGGSGKNPEQGTRANYDDGRARQVELWNPATQTWTLGAMQAEKRGYHSVALLLPDGRVLSSGDDYHGPSNVFGAADGLNGDTIELYSPPYLHKGTRPTITSAPGAVKWGATFGVQSPSSVTRAVLMGPGATTHAADMAQRHVELAVTPAPGAGLNATAPPNPTVAPPGWYMLFLLDDKGVPSVAKWIELRSDAPAAGTLQGLTRSPATAAKTTGEQHTVTFTLSGASAGPLRYTVTGANARTGTQAFANGQAAVVLSGTAAGTDTITAYADLNNDGSRSTDEPQTTATVTWTAPSTGGGGGGEQPPPGGGSGGGGGGGPITPTPALSTLEATQSSDQRTLGTRHQVFLLVRDGSGVPVAGRRVRYSITGVNPSSGSLTTNASGQVTASWTGEQAGQDTLIAYADENDDGARSATEPQAAAVVTWIGSSTGADTRKPVVKVSVTKRALRDLRRRGRLKVTFTTDEAGTATVELLRPGRLSPLVRDRGRVAAGRRSVTLRLSARTFRALRATRRLTLRVTVADAAGNAGRRTVRLALPR